MHFTLDPKGNSDIFPAATISFLQIKPRFGMIQNHTQKLTPTNQVLSFEVIQPLSIQLPRVILVIEEILHHLGCLNRRVMG